MRKFYLLLLPFFLCLAACSTTKPLTVTNTEVRYEKIPKNLTEPCKPEKPKAKADYLALKPHEREAYLTDYATSLLGTVKDCNIKLDKIDKLNGQLQ